MIATRPKEDISGYPSHSWYFGDPVFTQELALTLRGDLDRSVFPTRIAIDRNRYVLKAPGTPAVAVLPVEAAT
jgi:hypothetical protein